MNRDIQSLPPVWSLVAYILLGLGVVAVAWFLGRYMTKLPWAQTEEGRHLVAFSASVGAFFVLYLLLAVWPTLPGRSVIRFTLLTALIVNCWWRVWLLEKHLRERRQQ